MSAKSGRRGSQMRPKTSPAAQESKNKTAIVDWLIGLGDGVMKFVGTYIPGVDSAYESLKRKVNGGDGNYQKDAASLYNELQNAYKTIYGTRPQSPSDLRVLAANKAKEKYLELKGRTKGSDLEQAVRGRYASVSREADEAAREYSKAMNNYDKQLGQFESKVYGLQQAETQARQALENPQWKGSSPSQIIQNYEQGV